MDNLRIGVEVVRGIALSHGRPQVSWKGLPPILICNSGSSHNGELIIWSSRRALQKLTESNVRTKRNSLQSPHPGRLTSAWCTKHPLVQEITFLVVKHLQVGIV